MDELASDGIAEIENIMRQNFSEAIEKPGPHGRRAVGRSVVLE